MFWLSRIKQTVTSLGIVVIAYWVYSFTIVPLIEPPTPKRSTVTAAPASQFRSTDAFQNELSDLFPPDAWEMGNVKILRSGGTSLLFQDYQPNPNGTIHIFPCTAVIRFEKREDGKGQAPLILQAPEGAMLRLKGSLDLKAAKLGQPIAGRLLGRIQIHSPGRPDGTGKLQLLTSNVQINTKRLWTPNAVSLTYDQSRAKGRDLMIRLLPEASSRASGRDTGWAGIQSIELVELDELYLEIPNDSKQPPEGVAAEEQAGTPQDDQLRKPKEPTRVAITCDGQLRMDFVQDVVTFEERVRLTRMNPDAAEDTLECDRLQLFLQKDQDSADEQSKEKSKSFPQLDPHRVVAEGNPAVLNAPSKKVYVRSRKLMYDLQRRRFQLWASDKNPRDEVLFRHDSHEVYARALDAVMADEKTLDELRATGPGRYRGLIPSKTPQTMQAAWQEVLLIQRDGSGHVMTMNQSARVRLGADRMISAERIQLWFEPSDTGPSPNSSLSFRPTRLLALARPNRFDVKIESPELVAQTGRLEAQFRNQSPSPAANPRISPRAADRQGQARQVSAPRNRASNQAGLLRSQTSEPQRTFDVASQRIEMILLLNDKQFAVQHVELVGRASMKQRSAVGAPTNEEFQLSANAIRIHDAEGQGQHQVVAVGQPVDIQTDRFSLRTAQVQLDRAKNLMWSDGTGEMSILLDRDLNGRPLRVAQKLGVTWTDGMRFDGQRITLVGRVDVRGENQRIRASRMEVNLTKRIAFGESTSSEELDIQQVRADGNVLVENREVVDNKVNSVTYMQVPHIRIDRVSGDTFADGPGRIVTHRYGFTGGMKLPGGAAKPQRPSANGGITFVQVDFQRQLDGNVLRRVATLRGQVQVIYGPVMSWNESINPDTALGEDDVLLSCSELTFAQGAPLPDGRHSINMEAQGNTYVEGKTFTARGQRISFEQAKDLLVLEGTARSDAVLSHQSRIGAPRSETAARKILYWTTTGRVDVDSGRYVDLSNLGL